MGIKRMQFLISILILITFNLKGEDKQAQELSKNKNIEVYFYYSNYGKIYGLLYKNKENVLKPMSLENNKTMALYQVFTKKILNYDMKSYVCKIGAERKIYYAKPKQVVKDFEIFSSNEQIKIDKPNEKVV